MSDGRGVIAGVSARSPGFQLVRRPVAADPPPALDQAQRAVVAHTRGPLLVLGGPGTGKTTTVVEAVAARVAAGTELDRVLVLTFGRRAAGALRHRIARRVATLDRTLAVVPEPLVRTFHGYAFGLLRRAAARRGEPAPRLLTGPEQDVVIRELLAGDPARWPERLRAALPTREFARQLRDLLLRAAERGIDPAALAELAAKCGRDDWRSAAGFRSEYDAVLALRDTTGRAAAGFDYAELVWAAAGLLVDDPARLVAERRRLAAIYVDEFADTDPAQRDLLELIAGRGGPLVVFADPDAATFGFRGSDPEGVRDFPERFSTAAGAPARTVLLSRSYRAGPARRRRPGRAAAARSGPAPAADRGRPGLLRAGAGAHVPVAGQRARLAGAPAAGDPLARVGAVVGDGGADPGRPAARSSAAGATERPDPDRRARRGPAAVPAPGGGAAAAAGALRARAGSAG
jgi:hypothetical protein